MRPYARSRVTPVLICCLLAAALGCDGTFSPSIRGSGVAKTETRTVDSFSEIEVGSAIQLEVVVGSPTSIEVTADDNILPHIRTVVVGNRLMISSEGSYSTNVSLRVAVSTPTLRALRAEGAAKATVSGVAGEHFLLDANAASTCQITSDAEALDVNLSGASRGVLAGAANRLNVECSGASNLDAAELPAKKVVADLSGASTAHVHATDELAAIASGASTLRYLGMPAKLEKQTSGASSIAPE